MSAKLETGARWNWNIITLKPDYLQQRFQMGLEMTLCYSEIIGHSSSGGRNVKPSTLSWGHGAGILGTQPQHSPTLPCWEILGNITHQAAVTWNKSQLHIKAFCLGPPCSKPSLDKKRLEKNSLSPSACESPMRYRREVTHGYPKLR